MSENNLSCQNLSPFGACGSVGTCEVTNSTEEFCRCAAGWRQGKEMTLYFFTEEELDQNVAICNFNPAILRMLYILMLFSAFSGIICQLYFLSGKKQRQKISVKKQIQRSGPFFVGQGMVSALAIYRLARFEDAAFGKDTFFSFLVANAALCAWCAITVYNNRYFMYLAKKLDHQGGTPAAVIKRHQKVNFYLLISDFIIYQTSWIITLTPNQQTFGKLIMKICFGLMAVRVLHHLWGIKFVFDKFIRDIRALAKLSGENKFKISSDHQKNQKNFLRKKLLPMTIAQKRGTLTLSSIFMIFMVLCALSEYAFLFYGYLFPLNFIFWGIMNLYVIFLANATGSGRSSKNNSKMKKSFEVSTTKLKGKTFVETSNATLKGKRSFEISNMSLKGNN